MSDSLPTADLPAVLTPDQREISKLLESIQHDPTGMGCVHLGGDGVLRSLTGDRAVVDAVALAPNLLKAFLDRMPYDPKIEDMYRGVDGTAVARDQWFHPDPSILPPPLTKEEIAEAEKDMAELEKEKEASRQDEKSEGGGACCSVVVMADYNLDVKGKEGGLDS